MVFVALSRGFLPGGFLRSRPGRFVRTQVPACRSSQNENDTGEGKFMNGSLLVKNFLTNRLSEAAVSCALFVQMVDSLVTLHLRAVEETLGPEFSVHSSSPAQQSDRRSLRIQFRSISTERNSSHWRQTVRWCWS